MKKKPFNFVKIALLISVITTILQSDFFQILPNINSLNLSEGAIAVLITEMAFLFIGNFVQWLVICMFINVFIMISKSKKNKVEVGRMNGEPIEVNTERRNVHVSRGGIEDATFRKATGKSLAKDDCMDCTDKDPWEKPSFEGLKSRFKLFGGSVEVEDDVEAYYKERNSKKKGR